MVTKRVPSEKRHLGRIAANPSMEENKHIRAAINYFKGSRAKLGEQLGISWQMVTKYLIGSVTVPAERAFDIECVTHGKVTREMLRPDLYRKLRKKDYGMVTR